MRKNNLYKTYKVYKMVEEDIFCTKCNVPFEFTDWQNINIHIPDGSYEHKCPKCKKILMCIWQYPRLVFTHETSKDILKKLKINPNRKEPHVTD